MLSWEQTVHLLLRLTILTTKTNQMQQHGFVHLWLLGSVLVICLISRAAGINEDAARVDQEAYLRSSESHSDLNETEDDYESGLTGIPLVKYQWHHVKTPYLIIIWVFVAGLAKLGM